MLTSLSATGNHVIVVNHSQTVIIDFHSFFENKVCQPCVDTGTTRSGLLGQEGQMTSLGDPGTSKRLFTSSGGSALDAVTGLPFPLTSWYCYHIYYGSAQGQLLRHRQEQGWVCTPAPRRGTNTASSRPFRRLARSRSGTS
jgi:hypothetical protein